MAATNQQILEAVQDAIHEYLTSGSIQSRTLGSTGISLTKVSLGELRALRNDYQRLVNQERAINSGRRSKRRGCFSR